MVALVLKYNEEMNMKLTRIVSIFLTLGLISAFAGAQPLMVNYQGRLSQVSGAVFPNGPADVRIRLFDAATGGTQVWDSGIQKVQVRDGVFSLLLQGGTPSLSSAQFIPGLRYFEISVRQGANWTTLSPRQVVTSAPWALIAGTVPDGAIETVKLANAAVTTSKIATQAVNTNQLAVGAVWGDRIADGAVTTAKIQDGAVTGSKIATGWLELVADAGQPAYIDFRQDNSSADFDYRIMNSGTNGTLHFINGNNNTRVTFSSQGLVGIGTTSPSFLLDVNGTTRVARQTINGPVEADHRLTVYGTAAKSAGGSSWATFSDKRLKHSIRDIDDPLRRLLQLHGRTYQWREAMGLAQQDPGTHLGFIAQEVEQVFPQWVSMGSSGYKLLNTSGLEALTVEAIRDQQNQIESLKAELAREKAARSSLERRLGEIERLLKAKR